MTTVGILLSVFLGGFACFALPVVVDKEDFTAWIDGSDLPIPNNVCVGFGPVARCHTFHVERFARGDG